MSRLTHAFYRVRRLSRMLATNIAQLKAEYFTPALFLVQISRCRRMEHVHIHWQNYNADMLNWLLRYRDEETITSIRKHGVGFLRGGSPHGVASSFFEFPCQIRRFLSKSSCS